MAIHHSHGFEAAHDVQARVRCATSVGRLYVRGQWQWAGLRVLSRVRGRGSGVLGRTYSARRRGGSACASPRGRRGRSQRRRGCGWPIAPARDDCIGSRGGYGYWPLCHRVCGRFGSTSRFVHRDTVERSVRLLQDTFKATKLVLAIPFATSPWVYGYTQGAKSMRLLHGGKSMRIRMYDDGYIA